MNEHSTQLEKWHALAAHAEGCLRVRYLGEHSNVRRNLIFISDYYGSNITKPHPK